MPTISLCMIVKDEEKILERHLKHIKDHVDEIIIVDTGSKDKTVEIAKKYTKKVYDFKWCDDFSKARNFSLSKATKEWILVLDADEFIEKPERLKKVMADHKAGVYNFRAFVTRIDYNKIDDNKYIRDKLKKALVHPIGKLFRKSSGIHYKFIVHEVPILKKQGDGTYHGVQTDIKLLHLKNKSTFNSVLKYYAVLCQKAVDSGNFDCNIVYNLLDYYSSNNNFGAFNEFFEKIPFFEIEKRTYPYMIRLIKKIMLLNKDKEAKKLADILYENMPNEAYAVALSGVLKTINKKRIND